MKIGVIGIERARPSPTTLVACTATDKEAVDWSVEEKALTSATSIIITIMLFTSRKGRRRGR